MTTPNRLIAEALLADALIQGTRRDDLVARAVDPAYWRSLVPSFHVESGALPIESAAVDPDAVDTAARALRNDGYFKLPKVLAPRGVERMNAAIDTLVAAGWPPTFVFVYDEAWQCARTPAARALLDAAIGPGCSQIRYVWAHVVDPIPGAFGWAPHIDGSGAGLMTIWVGLTDATVENGCMHAISLQASAGVAERFGQSHSQFSRKEVESLLQAAHALESAPGDALGWSFDVVHWGGVVRSAGRPRRALSFEYVSAEQAPTQTHGPATSMDVLLPFRERLTSIVDGVLRYSKFEPLVGRFAGVARDVLDHLANS